MSMTDTEDTTGNDAELTPEQPCAVCGAEYDESTGTMVGRVDESSDIPLGLLGPNDLVEGEDPWSKSFCNECIKDLLMEVQTEVKILRPRKADLAAYMLLGLKLSECHEVLGAREGDSAPGKRSVHEYRSTARRCVQQAMDIALYAGPILEMPQKKN